MSEVLSNDAVAALVEAAREGRLPEERASAGARRPRRLRTVDFTRPTTFSHNLERRLRRTLETFCRTTSTRLSAELRMAVELEVINTGQLTWSMAHGQLPPNALSALVETDPGQGRVMLVAELPLVMLVVERLLGGSTTSPPKERRLSDIDLAVAKRFYNTMLTQLGAIWRDVAGLDLRLDGLESHTESAQMAPVSEPTLALTMEARLHKRSFTVAMLVPWSSVAPVAAKLASADELAGAGDADTAQRVRSAINGVDVEVRAQVGGLTLRLADVLALAPGDLVPLGAPASAGAVLYADAVPVHKAIAGRSGRRRAIQVVERLEPQ